MVQKIWKEIIQEQEVRQNLSKLRELVKQENNRIKCRQLAEEQELFFATLLQHEDPKTRKNVALLVGELGLSSFQEALWSAYEKEDTLFVRSSYLVAMQKLDMKGYLTKFKERLEYLSNTETEQENKKHIQEEMKELTKLVISIEGVKKHTFIGWQKESEIILLANRRHIENVLEEIKQLPNVQTTDAKLLSAGIRLKTGGLEQLMEIRTWQDILFLVPGMKVCEKEPIEAADRVASSKLLEFLTERHIGKAPFYFRVEVKMQTGNVTDNKKKTSGKSGQEKEITEAKNRFIKKFVQRLEEQTNRQLINSPSDYEIEIRLVENKEGKFNTMVKLYTLADDRFSYRKEVVASSIRPVNAALIVSLAKEYMVADAQVLDPFCGVGTMLIERQKKVPANTSFGIDILEEAIEKARINTEEAGQIVHYVNRDCITFVHEYLFDEIFTNMPFVQGRKTALDIYEIYEKFFAVAGSLLKNSGMMILYTHDKAYIDKLAPKYHFEVEKRYQVNVKEDTWVYIVKRR